MLLTPNVKRLVFRKVSLEAIPNGSGGLQAGIDFLSNPKRMKEVIKASCDWTEQAIELVRLAAEPNLWRKASNEEIAGEILRKLQEDVGKVNG